MATRMFHREETRSGLRSALTWDGALQYKKTGVIPPYDGNLSDTDIEVMGRVRADSAVAGGLRMVETLDSSNRPIRTFVLEGNATKRDTWMKPYMGPVHQMLRICKEPQTPQQNAAFEDQWRAGQAMIATGQFKFQEI